MMSEKDKRTESLYENVWAVLNKLTPQNFDALVNQVRQLIALMQIDNIERLHGVLLDLVFERATGDPNFSPFCARLCKEIQNIQVPVGDEKENRAFQTLLVSRCQMELTKQFVDESEKNKMIKEIEACTDPEKKKELHLEFIFEFEEYDRRLRVNSVGTIRFIGELFNQQMLTPNILRRYLQILLDNKDEDSLECSLECLCILLTTIGKELLDSKSIDLTTIFEEMNQYLTEGKLQRVSISRRTLLMLQDVIDFRDCKWSGSNQLLELWSNTNPSTLDELQRIIKDKRPLRHEENSRRNKVPYNSSKEPSIEGNSSKSDDGRSQHRDSGTPMRSTGPPPSSASMMPPGVAPQPKPQPYHTPLQTAPVAPLSVPKFNEKQIKRWMRNSLEEFVTGSCTSVEYFQDVASVLAPSDYSKAVYESFNFTLDKSQSARLKTGELFAKLIASGSITMEDFAKGFKELLALWKVLQIDTPQIWQYFAEDILPLLLEEVVPFHNLPKLLDGLIDCNVAKKLLTPLFALLVKDNKGPIFLYNGWQKAGLQLSNFMPSIDVQSFVQENNLDFLLDGNFPPVGQSPLSYEDIHKKISQFLQTKTPFEDIVNWISASVGEQAKEYKFIGALTTAILENSISKNELEAEVLASHTKLIQKYVTRVSNTDCELQCLYALQSLVHKLEHSQGHEKSTKY